MERTGQYRTGQDRAEANGPQALIGRGAGAAGLALRVDGSLQGRYGVVGVRKSERCSAMMMQLENGSQDQLAASVVGSVGDSRREGGSEGGRAGGNKGEDSTQHCASCRIESIRRVSWGAT